MKLRLPVAAALLVAAATAAPRPAAAYVQYRTSKGVSYKWCDAKVGMTAYVGRPIDNVSSQDMAGATSAALATWSAPAVRSCATGLQMQLTSSREPAPQAVLDHRNSIIFRTDSWDWQGPPPDGGDDPNLLYDPSALALTTLFVMSSGRIVDTDIEVNAVSGHFLWTWSDQPGVGEQDLQNTLTHEIGHVIGLNHTCWKGSGVPPTDDQGNDIPSCTNLPATFEKTTMYPDAQPQDVSKRVLGGDEMRAVCAIYPAGAPSTCPDEGCGCAVRAGAGLPASSEELSLAAVLLAVLVVIRRRRPAH